MQPAVNLYAIIPTLTTAFRKRDQSAGIDGVVSVELGLKGKPAPDVFTEEARQLGVQPQVAAVFEDPLAGVEAGKAGGFALVVGINRTD